MLKAALYALSLPAATAAVSAAWLRPVFSSHLPDSFIERFHDPSNRILAAERASESLFPNSSHRSSQFWIAQGLNQNTILPLDLSICSANRKTVVFPSPHLPKTPMRADQSAGVDRMTSTMSEAKRHRSRSSSAR